MQLSSPADLLMEKRQGNEKFKGEKKQQSQTAHHVTMVFMGFSHPTEVTKEQQNCLWVLSPVLPEPLKVQMSHKSARCQAARRE